MFTTRVTRQIEAAHRNGPPSSKCHVNHGHSWLITVQYSVSDNVVNASEWGWGVDFAEIKEVIDRFDHQDLNQLMEHPPSAENLAQAISLQLAGRVGFWPDFVEVKEGKGNSVRYVP